MKKKLINNKGISGIDTAIAITVLALFAGVIITLMGSIYKRSIEIQKSANAMAYATIILEKVDEKSYEQVDNNFVNTLKSQNEIQIDSNYTVSFSTSNVQTNFLKKVSLRISYNVGSDRREILINKLKIKEI